MLYLIIYARYLSGTSKKTDLNMKKMMIKTPNWSVETLGETLTGFCIHLNNVKAASKIRQM